MDKQALIRALLGQNGNPYGPGDPQVPELQNSQGGSFFTPILNAVPSALTLPRDVYQGTVDPMSDEGIQRSLDMAGIASLGSFAAPAQGGAVVGSGPIRRAKPMGPMPEMATRYPELAPPVEKFNPDGSSYLGKQLSPEAKQVQKLRLAAQKDIDAGNYTPYFDVSKRADVDPSNYPMTNDTLGVRPVRPDVLARELMAIDNPEVRGKLQEAYRVGSEMPDTENWYFMKQLEDRFIQELGEEAGRQGFRDKFAFPMAATTGGASPKDNLTMAMYGNYLREHNLPYPQYAYEMPYPVGGRYATGNMNMHDVVATQGGFSPNQPKRHNFAANFLGHADRGTIDEQMTRGMVNRAAPGDSFGLLEEVLASEAGKTGVAPRGMQDVAWSGFKNMVDPSYTRGRPMIQEINEAIERTSRITGLSPDEVLVQGIIRSKIPIYGLGGAAVAGSALQGNEGR